MKLSNLNSPWKKEGMVNEYMPAPLPPLAFSFMVVRTSSNSGET